MNNENRIRVRRPGRTAALSLAGLLGLAAVGLSLPREFAARGLRAESFDRAQPPRAGGRIEGSVRFKNEVPGVDKIEVTQDQEVCGDSKESETFVVSPDNKGLKNVLVTVEGVTGGEKAVPVPSIMVEQKGCVYVPHLQVAEIGPRGLQLIVRNEDGILHNINASLGGRTLFNSAQPSILKVLKKKLRRPGVVNLTCDVHEWMNARIVLLKDQPYYSVSAGDGSFAIDSVPPGTYTLHAWHEALGEMTRTVTVVEGRTATVDFVISPRS